MNREKSPHSTPIPLLLLFWLYVLLPLSWGVWSTLRKAMALFN